MTVTRRFVLALTSNSLLDDYPKEGEISLKIRKNREEMDEICG